MVSKHGLVDRARKGGGAPVYALGGAYEDERGTHGAVFDLDDAKGTAAQAATSSATSSNAGDRFQILSLDGGGLRGIFSAAVLARLEEDLGTSIADHFDMIAGTSTGGIIALGLGLGMRPRQIVEFYTSLGPRVFRDRSRYRTVRQLLRTKYSEAPLRAALTDVFGDRTFGESTKRLVITSYNLGTDDVYLFRTAHHPRLRRDWREHAVDVAMATSAAPTYLPGFPLAGTRLVDGGLWANNPAMVAVVEAVSTCSAQLEAVSVFSLGTTVEVKHRSKRLDRGGFVPWARSAVDVILRARAFYGGPTGPNGGEPPGLLDTPDWQNMTLTDAAQAVQRSAFPGAYARWETYAAAWLAGLVDGEGLICTDTWVVPIAGHYTITARFGQTGKHWATTHTGIDLAAPIGREVLAAAGGQITFAGWDGQYGRKVEITHADGTRTWYAHLSAISVPVHSTVVAGEVIGRVGMTGNTTGSHLHFEVRPAPHDSPVDAVAWMKARGVSL